MVQLWFLLNADMFTYILSRIKPVFVLEYGAVLQSENCTLQVPHLAPGYVRSLRELHPTPHHPQHPPPHAQVRGRSQHPPPHVQVRGRSQHPPPHAQVRRWSQHPTTHAHVRHPPPHVQVQGRSNMMTIRVYGDSMCHLYLHLLCNAITYIYTK